MARTGQKSAISAVTEIPDYPPEGILEAARIPTAGELEELHSVQADEHEEEDLDAGQAEIAGSIGSALYVGREFTMEQFAAWLDGQPLGSLPFDKIIWHHTWKPTPAQYTGPAHIDGLYINWYWRHLGWPLGRGPHIFLYVGNGGYKRGQVLVYVCTHPQHDGIHAINANHRTVGVEMIHDGEANAYPQAMVDAASDLTAILRKGSKRNPLDIPTNFLRVTDSSRAKGHGAHRFVPGNSTSCPGRFFNPDVFISRLRKGGGAPDPEPHPGEFGVSRYNLLAINDRAVSKAEAFVAAANEQGANAKKIGVVANEERIEYASIRSFDSPGPLENPNKIFAVAVGVPSLNHLDPRAKKLELLDKNFSETGHWNCAGDDAAHTTALLRDAILEFALLENYDASKLLADFERLRPRDPGEEAGPGDGEEEAPRIEAPPGFRVEEKHIVTRGGKEVGAYSPLA